MRRLTLFIAFALLITAAALRGPDGGTGRHLVEVVTRSDASKCMVFVVSMFAVAAVTVSVVVGIVRRADEKLIQDARARAKRGGAR